MAMRTNELVDSERPVLATRGDIKAPAKPKVDRLNGPAAEAARQAAIEAVDGAGGHHVRRVQVKPIAAPDRLSVRHAMDAIEARLVEAIWVLKRLPDHEAVYVYGHRRNGMAYVHDPAERFANAVANEGRWEPERTREPVPSGRAIDRMQGTLDWLRLLPRDEAAIVFAACSSKHGDPAANVSWRKVRAFCGLNVTRQRLAQIYEAGLRTIAAEVIA